MLVDAFEPMGVTQLAVDSIFMMPQLGVLASIHQEAATEVFERDCLIMLGTVIAPVGKARRGKPLAKVRLDLPDGPRELTISAGDLDLIPAATNTMVHCRIEPAKGVDVGAGPGVPLETELAGGEAGILIDGRGRPLQIPLQADERVAAIEQWIKNLDIYPQRKA